MGFTRCLKMFTLLHKNLEYNDSYPQVSQCMSGEKERKKSNTFFFYLVDIEAKVSSSETTAFRQLTVDMLQILHWATVVLDWAAVVDNVLQILDLVPIGDSG